MLLKFCSILIILFLRFTVSAQSATELNAGLNSGAGIISGETVLTFGANLEYKPKNALFSFSTDPFVFILDKKVVFTAPLYLKFIFGDKFKICPSVGGFIRTIKSYGWLTGLHCEYIVDEKFTLFSKNELYIDYWKDYYPSHFGGISTYTEHGFSILLSLGLKINMKK